MAATAGAPASAGMLTVRRRWSETVSNTLTVWADTVTSCRPSSVRRSASKRARPDRHGRVEAAAGQRPAVKVRGAGVPAASSAQ